jgi:hypothetical protein
VVAVAALALRGEEVRGDELGEVPARGLRAHPRVPGEFPGRQGPPVHQGRDEVGAGRIADQGGDLGEGLAGDHGGHGAIIGRSLGWAARF